MAELAAEEEGQATTRPASRSMLELEESLLGSRAENKADKTVCIKTFLGSTAGKVVAQLMLFMALFVGGYFIGMNALQSKIDDVQKTVDTLNGLYVTMNEAYNRLSDNYQALQEKQAKAEKNFKDLNDQFEAVRKVVQTAKESLSQIAQTSADVTEMGKAINATTTGFLGDVEAASQAMSRNTSAFWDDVQEAVENIKKVNKSVIEELEKSSVSGLRNEIGEVRAWQAIRDLQIKVDAWCNDKTAAETMYGGIAGWDVSEVEDFSWLFFNKASCNPDISKWNVGKATKMQGTFCGATSFNADISEWDTSKVTDTLKMFWNAASFNADISKWDTSKVTDMRYMFQGATKFKTDISKWDTSKVADMLKTFWSAASFNADISEWDTSKVTDMRYMFDGATNFNQPGICSWDHSKVTVCDDMFTGSGMNCPSWKCL